MIPKQEARMINQARAVIIGGGITGCSVLYHLAKAGWKDVVLLEKGELTSGATCHAAGMLTRFNTSPTIMRMRKYSAQLYSELNAYEKVGSVNIAGSPEMLKTLKRNVSRARGIGLEVGIISPEETLKLIPWASPENIYGAVHIPGDGHIDPHGATYAVAKAATTLGAEIHTKTRVTGIEVSDNSEVTCVKTDKGDIRCEIVINAAGIWTAQVAAMVGARVPCTPVVHQHIAMEPVAGHEVPGDSPTFRDYEYLVYGRPESGGYLVGGWELNPPVRWIDGVPWDHESSDVPNDFDRFAPMLEDTIKRFPFLADSGVINLVAHPDAFTPDNGPLLGPWPGVRGFWFAGASCMHGFGGGGGFGKILSEWITTGQTEWDVHAFRAWRFSRNYSDPYYAAECARECYKYYYHTHYPHDESNVMRPRRVSALHHRLQDLGAVFGAKNGWERVNYFEPGKPWRRAAEEQREWGGWLKPLYFETVARETEAVRKRAGIFDMSSFGKIELKGPGALPLIQRITANDIDRPSGSVTYTQFLNKLGGIVGDVVVTRLEAELFRIITGSGSIDSDLGHIRLYQQTGDPEVIITNVTDDDAVIGLWGPCARNILQAVTDTDVSNHNFPYMTAKYVDVNGIKVLAQRVTYVGESGWELYVSSTDAIFVWDKIWAAGEEFKIAACGYKAIDSLRLEKGFLAFGSDITPLDNPYEARLGFCVRTGADTSFIGKDAIIKIKEEGVGRRLCTLVIGDVDYLTLYGGEAVVKKGQVVSRLRSAGYGHHVRKNIGYAYLPLELAEQGTKFEIEIFGEMIAAEVAPNVLYDPDGEAIRR
ncbi:FAD-dependent oxidoreductase [Desulfococcaceae bacterium HSG9]|nr:FAD-dependent oxidoreductase [Desulfococcaceae bacterium HSG9]